MWPPLEGVRSLLEGVWPLLEGVCSLLEGAWPPLEGVRSLLEGVCPLLEGLSPYEGGGLFTSVSRASRLRFSADPGLSISCFGSGTPGLLVTSCFGSRLSTSCLGSGDATTLSKAVLYWPNWFFKLATVCLTLISLAPAESLRTILLPLDLRGE